MQFHAYELAKQEQGYTLKLAQRLSTDTAGIAACLGLQVDAKVELVEIMKLIEAKLPQSTLLTVGGGTVPVPDTAAIEANEA